MNHFAIFQSLCACSTAAALALGCASGGDPADPPTTVGGKLASDPGALVRMEMASTTGVLLDDIPAGPAREAAAAEALAKPDSFWVGKAKRQIRLTNYRLVFRSLYYPASSKRGPLPLPPEAAWTIGINGKAKRVTNPQHDIVQVDYNFSTHILSDAPSPAIVEPNLAAIGGKHSESFNLPTDPDQLFERTGYACMDEDEYPPNSVFEANPYYFFDDSCTANKGPNSCHITNFPQESCVESLQKHTGVVKTAVNFTRVAYSKALADTVRVGTITNPNGADLAVIASAIEDEQALAYRYFNPGACELAEGVISKLGWRRILMFSATVRNDGSNWMHIGDLSTPASPWLQANIFEWSACHGHYHFSHYGTFGYNGAPGSKRAFCLEDTNRFHNDEFTPLKAEHQSCKYQGITRGWGDEYEFGIPGQWVDVTDVDVSTPHALSFDSNPDGFLCEGTPALDANGQPIFDPTQYKTAAGLTVNRIRCDMPANWQANNHGEVPFSAAPGESFVTASCKNGDIGPLRNCGFKATGGLASCTPGSTVKLTCTANGADQVVRVCERSAELGIGIPCTLQDSSANTIVSGSGQVSFTCPSVRDGGAGVGGYAVYTGAVVPSQGGGVTCKVQ